MKIYFRNKTALFCALGALIILFFYFSDIYYWSGVTISGGHNSQSYIYINQNNDPGSYMANARGFIDGTWPEKPYFRAPLYSYFLAACIAVSDSIAWCVFVQLIFTAGTVFLLCKISKLLFDNKTGILATLMLMLYGGFVFITVVLHTAVMETFFAVLAFYCLCLLRKNFNYKNAIFAGVSAALAGLVRPNFLLICPLGIVFAFIEYFFAGKRFSGEGRLKSFIESNKRPILVSVTAMFAFFLILSPFVIRNNLHSDKPVFLTTNAEITWRQSNSYDSPGVGIFLVPTKPLMSVTSFDFWKHQLVKTKHYIKSVEVPQNVSYYIFLYFSRFLKFLPFNFGLINALFLASLFYFFKEWRKYWPIAVYPIFYALTIIAFNITGRYRLPVVPIMLIPSAGMIIDVFKNRRSVIKSHRFAITVIVFIVFLVYSEPFETADNFNSWGNQARRSMFEIDLPEYRYCISRMFNINPNDRNVRMTLATSSAMVGDFKLAEEILQNELKFFPEDEYLKITIKEVERLKSAGHNNHHDDWLQYIRNTKSPGHLAGQYKLYLRNIGKRDEFGLDIDDKEKALLIKSMKH